MSSYRKNLNSSAFLLKELLNVGKLCMLLDVPFFYYNPPPYLKNEVRGGGGVIKESPCLSVRAKLGSGPYFS